MGMYDIPAIIQYVSNLKKSKVLVVAYSMGTTASYVMGLTRRDIENTLVGMIHLAPVANLTGMSSPIKYLAPTAEIIEVNFFIRLFGIRFHFSEKNIFFIAVVCDSDRWLWTIWNISENDNSLFPNNQFWEISVL